MQIGWRRPARYGSNRRSRAADFGNTNRLAAAHGRGRSRPRHHRRPARPRLGLPRRNARRCSDISASFFLFFLAGKETGLRRRSRTAPHPRGRGLGYFPSWPCAFCLAGRLYWMRLVRAPLLVAVASDHHRHGHADADPPRLGRTGHALRNLRGRGRSHGRIWTDCAAVCARIATNLRIKASRISHEFHQPSLPLTYRNRSGWPSLLRSLGRLGLFAGPGATNASDRFQPLNTLSFRAKRGICCPRPHPSVKHRCKSISLREVASPSRGGGLGNLESGFGRPRRRIQTSG